MTAPAESLFSRGLRVLGAAKLQAQLAAIRLTDFAPDVAEDEELTALEAIDHLWELVGRPEQLPPAGDWQTWVIQAGRGFGKTRAGAQTTVGVAEEASRWVSEGRIAREEARLHVIAPTSADLRDTIVEGPGSLLRCSPPWFPADYEPSKRRVTWPNGVEALLFSAEEGDRLRGPQALWLWGDELAAWRLPEDAWTNAMLRPWPRSEPPGDDHDHAAPIEVPAPDPRPADHRRHEGPHPRQHREPGAKRGCAPLRPISAVSRIRSAGKYQGEILTDNPLALWHQEQIDAARVKDAPPLTRIVVAVDPAVTSREDSDETGIVVVGVGRCSCQGAPADHGFVLADRSGIYSPDAWARAVAGAYETYRADRVVAEVNNGGELVEATLRTVAPTIPYRAVHASRGKAVRAEPIAALYEQGKVHHVGSLTAKLQRTRCRQWNHVVRSLDSGSPRRAGLGSHGCDPTDAPNPGAQMVTAASAQRVMGPISGPHHLRRSGPARSFPSTKVW